MVVVILVGAAIVVAGLVSTWFEYPDLQVGRKILMCVGVAGFFFVVVATSITTPWRMAGAEAGTLTIRGDELVFTDEAILSEPFVIERRQIADIRPAFEHDAIATDVRAAILATSPTPPTVRIVLCAPTRIPGRSTGWERFSTPRNFDVVHLVCPPSDAPVTDLLIPLPATEELFRWWGAHMPRYDD